MSTPIETATEAILANHPVPKADPPGWLVASTRSDAQAAFASLSRHWDGLWDVIAEVRDASPRWPTDADTGDIVDAVLAYLTGESA